VGLSLIPIILGVSFASISELYFTWTSFTNAMLSNVAFAGRNVCSRMALDKPRCKNITPENLFAILTIISFIISIPLAIIFEGNKMGKILLIKNAPLMTIFKTSFETGMYFYLYNEAAMVVLNNINPVSHAIINTLKRIILLIVCVIFFNTPLTKNGIIGSSIAIFGSYLYAKAKKNN
jgi:solute carrier family 35 protein E1